MVGTAAAAQIRLAGLWATARVKRTKKNTVRSMIRTNDLPVGALPLKLVARKKDHCKRPI